MQTVLKQALGADAPPGTPEKLELCSFADMRLKVGDRAQLSPPAQMAVARLPVRIVGWVEGRSLITSAPATATGRLALQKDEHVLLRVFTGSSAFAFRSTVLKALRPPFEYLHLSFPDRVEALEIRNSPRYRVDLPAKAGPAGGEPAAKARVDNLSATGALVSSESPLGQVGGKLRVAFDFELHGVPSSLSLDATIKSAKPPEGEGGRHLHGVAFDAPAPNDQLLLRALVWYEMYEHPRNAV